MTLAAGTISLWALNNNLDDASGSYGLIKEATGADPVYGSAGSPEGAAYLTPDNSDVNTAVKTDGAITGTVKTLEFYWYSKSDDTNGRYMFDGDGGVNNCRAEFWHDGGTYVYTLGFSLGGTYWWHQENHSANTWYHYAITFDGTNIEIFQDNFSVKDGVKAYQSVDKTWILGNLAAFNKASKCYLDFVRISSVVQPGPYPTLDPSDNEANIECIGGVLSKQVVGGVLQRQHL